MYISFEKRRDSAWPNCGEKDEIGENLKKKVKHIYLREHNFKSSCLETMKDFRVNVKFFIAVKFKLRVSRARASCLNLVL